MSLRDWAGKGWLLEHKTSPDEISSLLDIVDRDIENSQVEALSADWRLNIAYNAALQAATAALAACGYRAARKAHHYRVIQSLKLTVGSDPETVARLDRFRKKRNISDYERSGLVSDVEADEMLLLAKQLRHEVREWLPAVYPQYLNK